VSSSSRSACATCSAPAVASSSRDRAVSVDTAARRCGPDENRSARSTNRSTFSHVAWSSDPARSAWSLYARVTLKLGSHAIVVCIIGMCWS
jgi:hypothetical protein